MTIALHNNLTLVPGDVVLVPVTVGMTSLPGHTIAIGVAGSRILHAPRAGVSVLSFAIAAGDEVRAVESMHLVDEKVWPHGIVVALNNGQAWVRWPLGDSLEPVASLQRVRTAEQVADLDPRPHELIQTMAEDVEISAQGADIGPSGDWYDPALDADRAAE